MNKNQHPKISASQIECGKKESDTHVGKRLYDGRKNIHTGKDIECVDQSEDQRADDGGDPNTLHGICVFLRKDILNGRSEDTFFSDSDSDNGNKTEKDQILRFPDRSGI